MSKQKDFFIVNSGSGTKEDPWVAKKQSTDQVISMTFGKLTFGFDEEEVYSIGGK